MHYVYLSYAILLRQEAELWQLSFGQVCAWLIGFQNNSTTSEQIVVKLI